MNQLQLLVRFSIVFVKIILGALLVIYTGTLLLSSQKTYDYEYFTSTEDMNYNKTTCEKELKGYCQNGEKCIIVEDVIVFQCPYPYGCKRCEKYLWYH